MWSTEKQQRKNTGDEQATLIAHPSTPPPPHTHTHRIHGIIGKVGSGFVGGRRRTTALPSRHVNGRQVRSHLRDLDGIECPKCVRVATDRVQLFQQRVQFVRLTRRKGHIAGGLQIGTPTPSFGGGTEADHVHGCRYVSQGSVVEG